MSPAKSCSSPAHTVALPARPAACPTSAGLLQSPAQEPPVRERPQRKRGEVSPTAHSWLLLGRGTQGHISTPTTSVPRACSHERSWLHFSGNQSHPELGAVRNRVELLDAGPWNCHTSGMLHRPLGQAVSWGKPQRSHACSFLNNYGNQPWERPLVAFSPLLLWTAGWSGLEDTKARRSGPLLCSRTA